MSYCSVRRRGRSIWLMASLSIFMTALAGGVETPAHAASAALPSPSGEITVVTVNAHQNTTDTARLHELALALSTRPLASDGNLYAPDVIVAHEMNVDASALGFRDELNLAFGTSAYQIVGSMDPAVKAKFFINTQTMSFETSSTWADVCESTVRYQLAKLREVESGIAVTVDGVHIRPTYTTGVDITCKEKNANEARRQLDGSARSIVGDFNKRPTNEEFECDPNETSGDLTWYKNMTDFSDVDGVSYIDAVRTYHRRVGSSLATEWTFEKEVASSLCDGSTSYKRTRLDYIFVSDKIGVMEAHSDHPGWAGAPGTIGCVPAPSCKYSDHRFVWGRFDLTSTVPAPEPTIAAPTGLTASAPAAQRVDLAWDAVTGADGYRVERSTDGAAWTSQGTSASTTYSDTTVAEGSTLYYRVLATSGTVNSNPSSSVSVTTPGVAPSQPLNVVAQPGKKRVTLSWSAATDSGGSGLAGYHIYRSQTSATTGFTKIATTTSTTYLNSGLTSRKSYWYYVTSYDRASNESAASAVVKAIAG